MAYILKMLICVVSLFYPRLVLQIKKKSVMAAMVFMKKPLLTHKCASGLAATNPQTEARPRLL